MGNVIIRNGEFCPSAFLHFMKNPFYKKFLWHRELWSVNWIICCGSGGLIGLLVNLIVNEINDFNNFAQFFPIYHMIMR
jgi:hypothetical protein